MNIHVENLSLNTVDADLRKLFAFYGEVSIAVIVRDKNNGRSKGNAFVEMPIEKQAAQAITALHHTMFDGKQISVTQLEYKPGQFNN